MNRLPEKLIKLRKHFQFSQEYVAKYLGIEVFDYIDAENGTKILGFSLLKRLAYLYDIDVDELFVNNLEVTLKKLNENTVDENNIKYFTTKRPLEEIKNYIKNHRIVVTIVASLIVAITILLAVIVGNRVTINLDQEISTLNRLSVNDSNVFYLDSSGGVKGAGDNSNNQLAFLPTSNIISIKQGNNFTVFLNVDGSVSTSNTAYKQEVSNWSNIVEIGAGDDFIVGLDKNGNVYYVGDNETLKEEVSSLSLVTKIFASSCAVLSIDHSGELKISGTLLGSSTFKNDSNILDVDTSSNITVILYDDNTVSYKDNNNRNFNEVIGWKNIVDVCCGDDFIAGLKDDGSVLVCSLNNLVSQDKVNWSNISSIDSGKDYLIGLSNDYEIYGVGNNKYNQFIENEDDKTLVKLATIDTSSINFSYTTFDDTKYKLNVSFNGNDDASSYKVEIECDDNSNQTYIIEDTSIDFIISNSVKSINFKITCLGDSENYFDSDTAEIESSIDTMKNVDNLILVPDIKGLTISKALEELMNLEIHDINLNVNTCDLSNDALKVEEYDGYDPSTYYSADEVSKLEINISKCGE